MLIFVPGNFTPGVVQATACTSVVYVDSAVRWRCNGAGGLGIVVRLRLFRAGFWRFCNSQCCASRSLPARWIVTSAFAGLAVPQAAFALFRKSARWFKFASFASVGAVLFSCRSPRGEFCEPPQGGASARTAEAGVYLCKPWPPRTSFSLHFSALPPVAYSSLRRSWEQFRIQNAKFTIMASMSRRICSLSDTEDFAPGPARIEDATPAAGPGEHTKNEYC